MLLMDIVEDTENNVKAWNRFRVIPHSFIISELEELWMEKLQESLADDLDQFFFQRIDRIPFTEELQKPG